MNKTISNTILGGILVGIAMTSPVIASGVSDKPMASVSQVPVTEPESFTLVVSPMGGYFRGDKARHHRHIFYPSISLGADFTPALGAEIYWGYMSADRNDSPPSMRTVRLHLAQLVGLYRFNTGSLYRPYLIAGIGMLHSKPNGHITLQSPSGDEDHGQFNVTGGGGLLLQFTPSFAGRFEVRDVLTTSSHANDIVCNVGVRWSVV